MVSSKAADVGVISRSAHAQKRHLHLELAARPLRHTLAESPRCRLGIASHGGGSSSCITGVDVSVWSVQSTNMNNDTPLPYGGTLTHPSLLQTTHSGFADQDPTRNHHGDSQQNGVSVRCVLHGSRQLKEVIATARELLAWRKRGHTHTYTSTKRGKLESAQLGRRYRNIADMRQLVSQPLSPVAGCLQRYQLSTAFPGLPMIPPPPPFRDRGKWGPSHEPAA